MPTEQNTERIEYLFAWSFAATEKRFDNSPQTAANMRLKCLYSVALYSHEQYWNEFVEERQNICLLQIESKTFIDFHLDNDLRGKSLLLTHNQPTIIKASDLQVILHTFLVFIISPAWPVYYFLPLIYLHCPFLWMQRVFLVRFRFGNLYKFSGVPKSQPHLYLDSSTHSLLTNVNAFKLAKRLAKTQTANQNTQQKSPNHHNLPLCWLNGCEQVKLWRPNEIERFFRGTVHKTGFRSLRFKQQADIIGDIISCILHSSLSSTKSPPEDYRAAIGMELFDAW